MPRVSEVLDCRKQNGLFGVEIEVEGANLPTDPIGGWNKVDDGSLRGEFPRTRCENVFRGPVPKDQAKYLITALAKAHSEANVLMSFRTSVHVHMNVQPLFQCELSTLLYLYVLMEPMLIKFCGDERIGNRFCLRCIDAESVIDNMIHIARRGAEVAHRIGGEQRYSAINLAAIAKYGSVEFRGMRGTLDVDTLHKWLDILDALRVYALNIRDPRVVRDTFRQIPFTEFVNNVFGKKLAEVLLYEGAEEDCILQHSISIEIPFSFIDTDLTTKDAASALKKMKTEKIDLRAILQEQAQPIRRRGAQLPPPINPVPEILEDDGEQP